MPESIPDFDLYAVLGLTPDADDATIRTAHREAVRLAHPDVAPDGDADDDLAKRLNVARDWLTDPVRRARYDEARGRSTRAAGPGATVGQSTAATTAESGVTTGLGRREVVGLLEVGWWLLLIAAAALIFATLLLIVGGL